VALVGSLARSALPTKLAKQVTGVLAEAGLILRVVAVRCCLLLQHALAPRAVLSAPLQVQQADWLEQVAHQAASAFAAAVVQMTEKVAAAVVTRAEAAALKVGFRAEAVAL
jgi:hypothetical protein